MLSHDKKVTLKLSATKLNSEIKSLNLNPPLETQTLLKKLGTEDKDDTTEIEKILIGSYSNKESQFGSIGYALTQIYLINNNVLTEKFA